MRRTRSFAVASLTAIALLAGCGGGDDDAASPSTTSTVAPTTTVAATTTTKSAEAVRAALLSPADIPGSTVSTSASSGDADFSACFPGNPLGAEDFPNEVEGPELELTDGAVQRQYTSAARQATEDQAKDFVTKFRSDTGAQCVLDAFKTFVGREPGFDATKLGYSANDADVGDGGAILTISGDLVAGTESIRINVDLLTFREGGTVVLMSAGAVQGTVVPGQAIELAKKIAGRL